VVQIDINGAEYLVL